MPEPATPQTELRDFFVYQGFITFAAAGQRSPVNINIQADADFVLMKLMSFSSDSPTPADGGALLNIIDSGSNRRLFDTQIPLSMITGNGQLPFIVPWLHQFKRQGTIELDLTNTGTATQTVRIALAGYKVFRGTDRL